MSHSINTDRPCPICDGSSRRLLYRQRFYPLAGATPTDGYDVVVCARCGFAFADRIPDQSAFDAYYREMSRYECSRRGGLSTGDESAQFGAIAELILPHMSSPRDRVIDVGCAAGGLLAALKSRGCADVLGLDPAPGCAEAAARINGVRVLTGTLDDIPDSEGKFDVLILVGVLEHVRDLAPFLGRVRDLLTSKGIVYVDVPDASNFAAGVNAPFQEFSVEHVNFFSPDSLANLMRRRGFMPGWIGRFIHPSGPDVLAPTFSAIFRAARFDVRPPIRDVSTEAALRAYIDRSWDAESGILRRVDLLARSGTPVVIWGVGSLTLRLLATSTLRHANVVAYVDSSPKVRGRTIRDVPVIGPDELAGHDEPILICSWGHRDEIGRQIRDQLRLSNPVFSLLDGPLPS